MFGFVVLSKENASEEERSIYKSHYCGLCHVLGERYGKKGMMALSYDMVFLEMLLSDLYDEEKTTGTETMHTHIPRPLNMLQTCRCFCITTHF